MINADRYSFGDVPVVATCHGQHILSTADVEGYEMTSYPALRSECEAAGCAAWVDEVTRDGNLVTARGWNDHPEILSIFREMLGTEVRYEEEVAPADD